MEKNQSSKKAIISLAVLVVVIAAMLIGYQMLKPKTNTGAKQVSIVVVSADSKETTYEVSTDAEYLRQVMDEADGLTYEGTDGNPGFIVETVNGETASYADDGAYWGFFINDEFCNYGIGEQPVADGDVFRIVYTIG